ncbi:hypothetical protein GCM10007415_10240 [Parapedobacter pyrenivorans]|uniref:Uncharacterized protein n=1 Tax=Parapedobacter pyrenivorans TaxID=1305674 RepID=A0A917HHM4_9SPHI|nr:hypothetical protein [Parapedobacter pyrenivorans]GGG79876.1 hypothetical protein GCM10007415_10240 [Parapedobacter pyrenivorans]
MKIRYTNLALILVFTFGLRTAKSQLYTPDVQVVSELVSAKQEEIKKRVLKNIVVKNIKPTNYTTYNTIYNLLDIITTEKNKTVMTNYLIAEIADYAITNALANRFLDTLRSPGIAAVQLEAGKNLYELMATAVELDETKKRSDQDIQKDITSKRKPEKVGMVVRVPDDVIVNFVVDTLWNKLSETAFFSAKGLFQKRPFVGRFKGGYKLDYSELDSITSAAIIEKMDAFIAAVEQNTASLDWVDQFLHHPSKSLDSLGSLERGDIKKLMELFSGSLDFFRKQIGRNSFIAKIGDVISTYVIIDLPKNETEKLYQFQIDVESIVLSLEDQFANAGRNGIQRWYVGFVPFFDIGINYGVKTNNAAATVMGIVPLAPQTPDFSQLAYVSEKFGFKIILADFKYTHSHRPMEWFRYRGSYRRWKAPSSNPLVSNLYLSLYGSGILYNVVNLKSEKAFDYAIAGAGAGVTFFNSLGFNLSYAIPVFDGNPKDRGMMVAGFDIPIFEYLQALRTK